MKRIVLVYSLVYSITHSLIGLAQTPITLDQALQQAQANRLELTNQQLQLQITANDEARRRATWQPQLTAGADFRWNTQIQRNIVKGGFTGSGPDQVLRFGTPINNVLNAQAEQKLYDAQSRIDRSINQVNAENQKLTLESLRITVRQQVTEAYYQAVLNREKIRLSERALARAQGYLEQAQTRFAGGTLLKSDLDRFDLDLRNAALTLRNDGRDYALSLDNLRYRINAPQANLQTALIPADSLTQLVTRFDSQNGVTTERVEVAQEGLNRQVNLLNEQRERARLLPKVTAYGAYFAQQLADTFNPFQTGNWYPYNYVGLRLSVPVFDGRQARLNRQDYVQRAQISQNTAQRLQNDFDYEMRSAQNTLQQAQENLAQTRLNITQAQQILEVDKVRFAAGTLLMADFRNSEYSLQQAENNYLRAVYDILLGQLQVRKATGQL
ncbi:TolC family protein [Fibrella aquatilis]|uniref:TolC family protein n=1 Tax=Fibrella aquatilis TaxID=2817059 RepID=A0A939G7F4_9BACT|nr:TolC family protein [Fibrella aquatilis]MBO0931158.1 TolC family protein [Fibrella aquatilis]